MVCNHHTVAAWVERCATLAEGVIGFLCSRPEREGVLSVRKPLLHSGSRKQMDQRGGSGKV